jgi:hypothetical protein
VYPLLERSGADFRSVYAGLPEEALGPASLFLVPIDDLDADWVAELDQIDLHSPCLSLIWSRVEIDSMVRHLQAFLFADIGEGMTAMVRFFDPRNIGAVFNVWDGPLQTLFMAPLERWMYRGRHPDWQRIENDSLTGSRIVKSIVITLDQADIDALTAHTEPDQLLASLTESGVVGGGERPYLERHGEFMPHYQRALQWGLTDAVDRLNFCQHSYLYGMDFDRHPRWQDALTKRQATAESFASIAEQMPAHVRDELKRRRDTPTRGVMTGQSDSYRK